MLPVTISVITIIGFLIFVLPKRYVGILVLIGSCYFTAGQYITIASAEFYVSRILIMFGFIRFFVRREFDITLTNIDKAMIVWSVLLVITGTILERSVGGFINRCGQVIDATFAFFIFRICIDDISDIKRLIRWMIVAFIPLAIVMVLEQLTARNIFGLLGGVSEYSVIRDGRVRASASFPHPILAGTVGGIHIPIICAMIVQKVKSERLLLVAGVITCAVMVITSASSGPIMTTIFGIFALILWKYRKSMKQFVLVMACMMIVMSFLMKAPVWFLIAKIDITGSSTGWHRAQLISSALQYLKEWWLIGTNYTRHWMPTGVDWSPNHTDITNYYIHWGVLGGLPTLISFIAVIVFCFRNMGKVRLYFASVAPEDEIIIWALSATLVAHVITFFTISYWDQVELIWNLHVALISSMAAYMVRHRSARVVRGIDERVIFTESEL